MIRWNAVEVVSRSPRRRARDHAFDDDPTSTIDSDRLLQSVADLARSCPAVNHIASAGSDGAPSTPPPAAVDDRPSIRAPPPPPPGMPDRGAAAAAGDRRRSTSSVPRRIRINVSGHGFEVPVRLLDRHPDTLLGNARRRAAFYDRSRDELFLDRHLLPRYFEDARLRHNAEDAKLQSRPSA